MDAIAHLKNKKKIAENPIRDSVAAIRVGIINGIPMLDLCYSEDSTAEVDMNIVMTGAGNFVEVQGTAEGPPFSRGELDTLLQLAQDGIARLVAAQKAALETSPAGA